MKNFLTFFALVAIVAALFIVSTPDTAEATGFANAVVVQNAGRGRTVVRNPILRPRTTIVRNRGNAAVAVNVGGFNRGAAVLVNPGFNRNAVFVNSGFNRNAVFVNTGFNARAAGFNAFGTRTVVDRFGNVFEQDAFGNVALRRSSSFGVFQPTFNTFNTGFSNFGSFGGVSVVRGFGGCR